MAMLLWMIACLPRVGSVDEPARVDSDPVESDTPAPSDTPDPDPPADTENSGLPGVTVSIEPTAPRWDQDLHCVVQGLSPEVVPTITWAVNGQIQPQMSDGVYPSDTVPHLRQAGGQHWACRVSVGAALITSATVRIEPPVPMIEVAGGTFDYPKAFPNTPITLTRDYLIGQTEMSRAQWEQWAAPAPTGLHWFVDTPDMPVSGVDWHAMMMVAGRISVADGLTPCGTCAIVEGMPLCEAPLDPYACEGYRLPTHTEWNFACTERGRHHDPVPAGGIPDADPGYHGPDPIPLVGPFAPPGAVLGDYCIFEQQYRTQYAPVDLAGLPNLIGMIGMCGNAIEITLDNTKPGPGVSATNPYEWEGNPPLATGRAQTPGGGFDYTVESVGCQALHGGTRRGTDSTLRLTRTLTPTRVP